MRKAQDHKDRAASLQLQVDSGASGSSNSGFSVRVRRALCQKLIRNLLKTNAGDREKLLGHMSSQMGKSQDHKDRAGDLQKQLDEAKAGQPASADREKMINQLSDQMGKAQEHKERAADLQRQLDEAKAGQPPSADREKMMNQLQE